MPLPPGLITGKTAAQGIAALQARLRAASTPPSEPPPRKPPLRPDACLEVVLEHRRPALNQWEREYCDSLEWRRRAGDLLAYYAHAYQFRLATRCYYTPDMLLVLPSRSIECHEVKGWRREDAMVKFRQAAEVFPWIVWRMVGKQAGAWCEVLVLDAFRQDAKARR